MKVVLHPAIRNHHHRMTANATNYPFPQPEFIAWVHIYIREGNATVANLTVSNLVSFKLLNV